jgi:hypothetical protein
MGLFALSAFASGGFIGTSIGDHEALIVDVEKEIDYTVNTNPLTRVFKLLSAGFTFEKFPQDKAFGSMLTKTTDISIYDKWGVFMNTGIGIVYLFERDRFAIASGYRTGFYYDYFEFYVQSRLNTFTYKTYQKALVMTGVGFGLRL